MTLLKWALICFVISLIAGGLGFTGIASGAGSLARRVRDSGITVNALHPGVINTGFAKNTGGLFGTAWSLMRPFLTTPEKGAQTSLHVASAPELHGVTGRYFSHSRPKTSSAESRDEAVQERVWALSLKQVGRSD